MTNEARGRVFLLVEIICWLDVPLNRLMTPVGVPDARGVDHFCYPAQDDEVRFAVCDCLIHFVFSIPFLRASFATVIEIPLSLEYDKSFRSLQRPESSSVNC